MNNNLKSTEPYTKKRDIYIYIYYIVEYSQQFSQSRILDKTDLWEVSPGGLRSGTLGHDDPCRVSNISELCN